MSRSIQVFRPWHLDSSAETTKFCLAHAMPPHYPEALIRRFLHDLTSSQSFVLDLWSKEREAVGVMLDKISNSANSANLEILAIREPSDYEAVADAMIGRAKELCQATNKSGFQVAFPGITAFATKLASKHRLESYYDTFDMEAKVSGLYSSAPDVQLAAASDEDEIYSVLTLSFAENPEASLPSKEGWRKNRKDRSTFRTWVVKKNEAVVAFLHLNLAPGGIPEIGTIGVLPNYRKQGIARLLIETALAYLKSIEVECCKLSVAVKNSGALDLYRSYGFQEKEQYRCFLYKK